VDSLCFHISLVCQIRYAKTDFNLNITGTTDCEEERQKPK